MSGPWSGNTSRPPRRPRPTSTTRGPTSGSSSWGIMSWSSFPPRNASSWPDGRGHMRWPKKVGPVNYEVRQLGRRKPVQLYHINLLKKWHDAVQPPQSALAAQHSGPGVGDRSRWGRRSPPPRSKTSGSDRPRYFLINQSAQTSSSTTLSQNPGGSSASDHTGSQRPRRGQWRRRYKVQEHASDGDHRGVP